VASVNEIFRLQDAEEYSAAERLYLSASEASRSAVVLAATRGRGLDVVGDGLGGGVRGERGAEHG